MKRFVNYLIAAGVATTSIVNAHGMRLASEIAVEFPEKAIAAQVADSANQNFLINSAVLKESPELRQFAEFAEKLYGEGRLRQISITGKASPDGPYVNNARLAADRANVVRSFFVSNTTIPDALYDVQSIPEDWQGLYTLVSEGNDSWRQTILDILNSNITPEEKKTRLKTLGGGRAWSYLAADVLPHLRAAVTLITSDDAEYQLTLVENEPPKSDILEEIPDKSTEVVVEDVAAPVEVNLDDYWTRHAYIKTNVPAWFVFWTNLAAEIDCTPHMSVNLSAYYSGFNYFHRDRKYRTLALMPELRFWPKSDNQGFFAGAHFGLAWYNVAFGGDYRYQDHDRNHPAIGGGISIGYRFSISRNKRWKLEASVGAGIYHLDYDMFENRINGLLVGRKTRTFYGLDNAALSICYMFDVNRKYRNK